MLGAYDNAKGDLDDDVMSKSIYVFSQIKYTKTKTYRRYISISANDTTQNDIVNSILLSICHTFSSLNSSLLGPQLCHKTRVIIEFSDSLKDLRIAKNDRKWLYDIGVEAIQ